MHGQKKQVCENAAPDWAEGGETTAVRTYSVHTLLCEINLLSAARPLLESSEDLVRGGLLAELAHLRL